MERTIVYKADNFMGGREITAGFYLTFPQAKQALEYQRETDHADGDYGMITEFDVETTELNKSGIENSQAMQLLLDKHEAPIYSYFI